MQHGDIEFGQSVVVHGSNCLLIRTSGRGERRICHLRAVIRVIGQLPVLALDGRRGDALLELTESSAQVM